MERLDKAQTVAECGNLEIMLTRIRARVATKTHTQDDFELMILYIRALRRERIAKEEIKNVVQKWNSAHTLGQLSLPGEN